jgi:hypothetical protein
VADPLEDQPAVEAGQVVEVGLPDVDDDEAARPDVRGEGAHRLALAAPGVKRHERVESNERHRERAGVRQPEADEVRLDPGRVHA